MKLTRCAGFVVLALLLCRAGYSQQWVGSWAASQQVPTDAKALEASALTSATLRQTVRLSLGGPRLRLRLSNVFGVEPLHLTAVHIAKVAASAPSAIDVATDRAVTFDGGRTDVTIPAGAEYVSDEIAYPTAALAQLAITIEYDKAPTVQTSHPGSRATSWLAVGTPADAAVMAEAKTFEHWFQISGVDVATDSGGASIVAFGDSITDGHGATTNGNDRWPDDFAGRLQANPSTRNRAVLNQGLGGNRLLLDGQGPNALARYTRDVLAEPGVRYVVIFEGVNDLGAATRLAEISPAEHEALVAHILAAYEQMIVRGHAEGLKIYGATITPYFGSDYYHPNAANEADRQKVNAWIRAAGHFDGVIDFDKVVADRAAPERLLPRFDSGDHLHPSAAGYHAMADSIPLDLFTK